MVAKIQIRRDYIAEWEDANTVLGSGEFGLEIETKRLKIGNGETPWKDLGYIDDTLVHIDGNETISGVKTFTDDISVKALVTKINDEDTTFLRASESGTVFISAYGNNKKIEFRPLGDLDSENAVIINSDGDIIGNKFIGTSDKALKDEEGNDIIETYATKAELPVVPTKVSELENDSNFATLNDVSAVDSKLDNKIDKNGDLNAFVIDADETENGWYRIWSDGFKEQGGTTEEGTESIITLEKPFTSKYTLKVTPYALTNYAVEKTSNEEFIITSSESCMKDWEARGY